MRDALCNGDCVEAGGERGTVVGYRHQYVVIDLDRGGTARVDECDVRLIQPFDERRHVPRLTRRASNDDGRELERFDGMA